MRAIFLFLLLVSCGDQLSGGTGGGEGTGGGVVVAAGGGRASGAGGGSALGAGGGAASQHAEITGGTRLKVWTIVSDDGARQQRGFWDTARSEPCTFLDTGAFGLRCYPYLAADAGDPSAMVPGHFVVE